MEDVAVFDLHQSYKHEGILKCICVLPLEFSPCSLFCVNSASFLVHSMQIGKKVMCRVQALHKQKKKDDNNEKKRNEQEEMIKKKFFTIS